jgi:hypothetical protein
MLIRPFVLFPAVWLLSIGIGLAAQTATPADERPGAPISTPDACSWRSIPFNVLIRAPQAPPAGLKPIQVLVDGRRVPEVSLNRYGAPVRVLLLVDSSGSMNASEASRGWGVGLPTAGFAMDAVPLNALVAFGIFAERLQLSQWQDRDGAREQALSLKYQTPKGKTALYSAIDEAVSAFRSPQFGDAIYLVTDGGEDNSKMSFHLLVENLVARGIRVFVFLVVKEYKTSVEREGANAMEDIANLTGGFLFRFPFSGKWVTTGEAAAAVKQVREQVASPYRLNFQLATPLRKEAKLKVETLLDPNHFILGYPRRLEPCTSAPPQ